MTQTSKIFSGIVCFLVTSVPAADWKIVQNSQAEAAIVLPRKPERTEKFAAAELKLWIAKITGCELPVGKERMNGKTMIYLGRSFAEKLFPDDLKALSMTDGFAIRRSGNDFYIFGGVAKGTLNGVYAFLENNSDLIWSRPGEFGVNFTKSPDFTIRRGDWREIPASRIRGWQICGYPWDQETELWNSRMRCNNAPSYITRNDAYERALDCGMKSTIYTGHSLRYFMPQTYFATHPDFFCLINGMRRKNVGKFQVCFSNMDGADAMAREVVAAAKKSKRQFFSIGVCIQDNWNLCECENCRKPIPLPDGKILTRKDGHFNSTRFYLYLNRIGEAMKRECPDKRISTFAYFFTVQPPAVKLMDNIDVVFCPAVKNDKYSILAPENKLWLERLTRWKAATRNLIWREYYGCGSNFPRPLAETAAIDMRTLKERFSFNSYIAEILPDLDCKTGDYRKNWDMSAMEFWVLSKLYWNPNADVEILRNEYLNKTYGPAAPMMKQFFGIIRKAWYKDPASSTLSDNHYKNAIYYIVEKNQESACRNALAGAFAAADRENVRINIRRTIDRFEEWMKNKHLYASAALKIPSVKNAAEAKTPEHPLWKNAALIESLQVMNRPKNRAKADTKIKVMHDNGWLYCLFECAKTKGEPLYSKVNGPDSCPFGDHVEIFCAPSASGAYYHFAADFSSDRYDAKGYDNAWNSRWKTSGGKNNGGYWILCSIPLSECGIAPESGREFYANFYRQNYTGEKNRSESSSWRGIGVHQNSGFGKLILEK